MPNVVTYLLPELIDSSAMEQLSRQVAVVIDVLRATTTMSQALQAGTPRIYPCRSVEEARELAVQHDTLLGGERQGIPIEGFNFGNSPLDYLPETIEGRPLTFTTTNGTKALLSCQHAQMVYLAAFVNLRKLVDVLQLATTDTIALVCSGTNGEITREDTLFAGAVLDLLQRRCPETQPANDQASLALASWQQCQIDPLTADSSDCQRLAAELKQTLGGRNLMRLGQESDIDWTAGLNRLDVLPCYDREKSVVQACN